MCEDGRAPLKEFNRTESDYLVDTFNNLLDQGQYTTEQLRNVSMLLEKICEPNNNGTRYAISLYLNTTRYSNPTSDGNANVSDDSSAVYANTAKLNRCTAAEFVMNELYDLFKHAAVNKSATLNFGSKHYYENSTSNMTVAELEQFYTLPDLITTLWIKSEESNEAVCNITSAINNHAKLLISKSKPDSRSGQQTNSLTSFLGYVDRVLDPILGFQRRLYWEGSNVLETAQERLGSLRGAMGGFLRSTRNRLMSPFRASSNSTAPANKNSTLRITNATANSTPVNRPITQSSTISPSTTISQNE